MMHISETAQTVTFNEGLPGFETHRRFRLASSPESQPFAIVQGLDDQGPTFVTIDPRLVIDGYELVLDQAEEARLGADGSSPLLMLSIVTVHPDGSATANLRAPLVINPASMSGIQIVAGASPYTINHPLRAA
jgi:flagellar assembly factor FliW